MIPTTQGEFGQEILPVVVVGAGVAGLTAAYRLAQAGLRPLVLESYPEAGGLARAITVGGEKLDALYHHIFTSDTAYTSLAEELGLSDTIEWLPSRMGFWTEGRLWDFGTPLSLVKFGPLSIADKFRFAWWTLMLQRSRNPAPFEDITAKDWVCRHMGRRVWEKVWAPLFRQKFSTMAEDVAMVWLWGKIALRGRSRSSSGMGERLGYMKGAFIRLVDALQERIVDHGGRILFRTEVRSISEATEGCFRVEADQFSCLSRQVLLATPADNALRIAGELMSPEEREKISALRSTGALCTVLELKQSLSPYYWLNIADASMPFGGLIEHTNYVPRSRYGNQHILYISNYLFPDDPLFLSPRRSLMESYVPALKRINPDFDESWINKVHHFRAESAQPVVDRGYRRRVPSMETSVPGLVLCTMAQIYPEDRGQNYAVVYGERAAEVLISRLRDR